MASQMQTPGVSSASADSFDFSLMAMDILFSMRLEIAMFASAVMGYLFIFSSRIPKSAQNSKLHAKLCQEPPDESVESLEDPSPQDFASTDVSLHRAIESGNHRLALKLWSSVKQFDQTPRTRLSQIVEAMQLGKKDGQFIVRELKTFFKKHNDQCRISVVNDVLETLGKRLDSQLMDLLVDMLPSLELKPDQQTYEIFLTMHATTRNFSEVQRLVSQMLNNQVEFSTRAAVAVIKAALQAGNFIEAFQQFSRLKVAWCARDHPEIESFPIPRHIMAQFVELACRTNHLKELVPVLDGVPLPEESISELLTESIRLNDSEIARSIESLARTRQDPLSDSTYALLIKGLAGRPWRVNAVVQEVLSREPGIFSSDLALSLLSYCSKTVDKHCVADKLLDRMKPTQINVLTAFIRFYVETEQLQKACDVFEHHVLPLGDSDSKGRFMIDSRVQRSLMSAALTCGRNSLIQYLFDSSRTDVAKHVVMIRKCATENNLKGAMSLFNSLKEGGAELNSIVYNTVLDACVKCHDLQAAEAWMKQMQEAGMVDVVSFNTLIKAHLTRNSLSKARELMEQMKTVGLQPNRVTYNEVLNAVVTGGSRRSEIWEVVKEMKEASIPPNQVTCSILLKTLNAKSSETDTLLTMDLIDALDEPMDEVLLSSVVEACVRIGKTDLLASKLEQLQGKDRIAVDGSHTCGSLIKAYGHAKDLEGVWRVWKDMRSKLIRPTSITLGCMVEAVVNNGDTEGAFELIQQIQQDEQCRDVVNAVIYCSLLKGFSREKKIDRVWDVYKEMRAKSLEMSLISFNTIIDACARAGRMDNLSKVMQDMKKHHVEPNLITFSTILKGHCQAGDIQLGFSVLQDMRRDTSLKPDEIMYNSLLDGCVRNNLFEEGMGLFDEMQNEGIIPSNFTLSIMVKLLNRSRKVEEAFALVRELPKRYKFKPNVHVYTNLIQACLVSRQPARSLAVLETMVRERVQPDSRTYAILIRASIHQDKHEQAVALFRAALGLAGAYEIPGLSLSACYPIDSYFVNETLTNFLDRGCAQTICAPLISEIRKSKLKVNIDQGLQRRIAMSVGGEPVSTSRMSPKGNGRGQRSCH